MNTQFELKNLATLRQDRDNLHIITFGGCGEFGANLTVYITDNSVIVVDCGIAFPSPTYLGIDNIVLDLQESFDALGGIDAYLLTHGHEDHIGAIPYFVQKWRAPIYGTSWTLELVKDRLKRYNLIPENYELSTVQSHETVGINDFRIQWIPVTHSIPMACSLLFDVKKRTVFHTGDFKIDLSPMGGPAYNMTWFEQFFKKPVDLLLADSTNATSSGWTPSEEKTYSSIKKLLSEERGLQVFTTFSSHFWRINSLLEICAGLGKKVLVLGASFNKTLEIARKHNYLTKYEGSLIQELDVKNYPRENIVILATGSQAEPLAALSRLVSGQYRSLLLERKDRIIFSSRAIPGNEKNIQDLKSQCVRQGIDIIDTRTEPDVHVSGHAHQEDLIWLLKTLKPRDFLPVHGSYTHLKAHETLVERAGLKETKILDSTNGNILKLANSTTSVGILATARLYLDAFSKVPLKKTTLNKRLKIGYQGLVLLTGAVNSKKAWIADLTVDLVGIEFKKEADHDLLKQTIKNAVAKSTETCQEDMNENCRIQVRGHLRQLLNKKITVISKIILIQN